MFDDIPHYVLTAWIFWLEIVIIILLIIDIVKDFLFD